MMRSPTTTIALGALASFHLWACSVVVGVFETDLNGDSGGNGVDAGEGDVVCDDWAVQPRDFDPCTFVEPTGSLDLRDGQWRYETVSGTLISPSNVRSTPTTELREQSGGSDIRVLSVTDLRIRQSASLLATGPYPLLILSFDGVRVEGLLSVSSSLDVQGAGSESANCGNLAGQDGRTGNNFGSGGGGGSLRATGGNGGATDGSDAVNGGDGGVGGAILTTFGGGCPGGQGGSGGSGSGGQAGAAGGGILLMARKFVTVQGQIGAGGQGGQAPLVSNGGGGGGGGSGGIVAINAESVIIEAGAVVAANGGGGGEGSVADLGQAGQDGQLSVEKAAGGKGGDGGDGGDGGSALGDSSSGRKGPRDGGGGGGGGGAAGVIVVSARNLQVAEGSVVSPRLTIP